MAKVTFNELIDSVRGKYCKKNANSAIFQKRATCNTVYHIHNPFTGPATAKQEAVKAKFTTVQAQVSTIMGDDTQLANYVAGFKAQSKYSTLRGYIFATLYKNA